ncbi:MAG: alpha/beta hydrolase [Dehalococcoidia bacterium]
MQFTSESAEAGVRERGFELDVHGERIPGLVWTPEDAVGPRPLILMGHGGTQHKRVDTLLARARSYVRHQRWAVAAIDAPGHGDRTTPEQAAAARAAIQARIAGKAPAFDAERMQEMARRTLQALPEWRATLDALRTLPEVGEGEVGYWGVSMGTSIGVPYLAVEPRVKCAVLGLNGLRKGQDEFAKQAASIKIPLLFVFQRNDELVNVEAGLALYDAFGSSEKTMHINPGGHVGIPPHEREDFERFFLRHLGPGGA